MRAFGPLHEIKKRTKYCLNQKNKKRGILSRFPSPKPQFQMQHFCLGVYGAHGRTQARPFSEWLTRAFYMAICLLNADEYPFFLVSSCYTLFLFFIFLYDQALYGKSSSVNSHEAESCSNTVLDALIFV